MLWFIWSSFVFSCLTTAHVEVFLVIFWSSLWTLTAPVWLFWKYSLFSCCHPWTAVHVWEDPGLWSVKAEKSSQTGSMNTGSPWSEQRSFNGLCCPLVLDGSNWFTNTLLKIFLGFFLVFFTNFLDSQKIFIYLLPFLAFDYFACVFKIFRNVVSLFYFICKMKLL